ncbi:hypothetical protein N7532_004194 [Penicillium argentinense]|uniref:NB-ARC domain-containing protein n=1 Tax=Penicillium argentinense TaxID=1131581 RepID=A0A9W9KEK7_9EURO|nr:uncharacterized protein N7532_004194 [Penicillium argentinense]KAJ5103665.1 hypothetical protein N7532_004194 [Penicillium argentinense]
MSESRPFKPFGLTQVYAPRNGTPTVDIVLVHGLNGHPHDSWTSKSTGCFWPADLLPDILAPLRPRILSYGYNANVTAFTDGTSRDSIVSHAETLASNLAANRNLRSCADRPIIFVCHSLGGLVVKRALIYSRSLLNEKTEHLRSVYVSTFGILFLGTPHNGSDVAKWGLLLHNICNAVLPKKFMEASPQLVKALRTNNETLQHINSLFADIMGRFHIYLLHETRSTDVRGTREIIVDEHSAAPYLEGVERMGIEADHSHMCKFDDENAAGYEVVAEALLRYSRQAPSIIADRWVEERKTRAVEKQAKAREIYNDRVDDPIGQSMPDLNSTGRSILALPRAPATEGRSSPVSDVSNSGTLSFSQCSHTKDPPLFVAPAGFHPNATFFGMQKELEILHSRLFKARSRPDRTMAVLISGVPGSGKTHLARQYVFSQRECYTGGIFWIDAKSRESAAKCFWEIAQAATLVDSKDTIESGYQESRGYINAVRSWLQTRHDWLLVFDGITFDHDEDINEFKPFLPWNQRCSIMYTSIDTTLRKKQRLFEPYCLTMPRMLVDDACKLLFKDLGIKKPTKEQNAKAIELVEHYECLPLAIHAIGHRLNATRKPIEKYHVKHQVTDKKLAEPFLGIMNDLYRLQQHQALNLINLLSFLGHHVPVGLLNLGKHEMSIENADILSSAQLGEDPDLDTTLGTLIHYGLIERTSDFDSIIQQNGSGQRSTDEVSTDSKQTPELTGSQTESSQEGFFSIYRGNRTLDVVKIHSVVQGFCRDELRIKDDEFKDLANKHDPGFYDSWLIVATRFLCKSYETAKERMSHYHDCGLVRDYREYETHASRLAELFPKKTLMGVHPPVLREARENLRQLMRSISNQIDQMSPSSSQEYARNQKSVFDRSSSSSSSFPESSAEEGISRQSTWNWTESGSPRAESPEEIGPPLRFRLETFPPHIYRQAGYESEEGYETDKETQGAVHISPALSQMSQVTEKPKPSPASSSPPVPYDDQGWEVVDRHTKTRQSRERQPRKRNRGLRRLRGARPAVPLVKLSQVQGKGSSSRMSTNEGGRSTILASAAEKALAAVRKSSNGQATAEMPERVPSQFVSVSKENVPTYANIAARRMLEADLPPRRPASMPAARGMDQISGLQMKPSVESLDGRGSHVFASPLAHELTSHELMVEPIDRSTYSEPGRDLYGHPLNGPGLHTAPNSQVQSRRSSLAAAFEPPARDLSASVPSLLPYPVSIHELSHDLSASTPSLLPYPPPPLPYDQDISITMSQNRQRPAMPRPPVASTPPNPMPISHPSAVMPGSMPLTHGFSDSQVPQASEPLVPESLSRGSSGYSHQSWATEPVRYPPRLSPLPSFQQPAEVPHSASPALAQPRAISGRASWTSEIPRAGSALQSDSLYPPPRHQRLGSVDERLRDMELNWQPDVEPAHLLHLGSHRVDVRDARQRLHEAGLLQVPRHIPTYQLYHPNLSGPLIQEGAHVYAPVAAPALASPPQAYGLRPRSGSSPSRPLTQDGLGVRF